MNRKLDKLTYDDFARKELTAPREAGRAMWCNITVMGL
jgi:hypothetical protein